jgi:thioredoxin reductase
MYTSGETPSSADLHPIGEQTESISESSVSLSPEGAVGVRASCVGSGSREEFTDVAIIGAGPYGLSLAAHLRSAGVDYRIYGKTMESWKHGMPPGMLLKSHPWSSFIYDPGANYTLEKFCAEQRISYHPSLWQLPLETFIEYGEAFQRRFAPDLRETKLVDLAAAPLGFRLRFEDGDVVLARRVVLAVGVHPFRHTPPILSRLPDGVVSHSSDYGPLEALDGRDVVVVGSGSSAIDLTTLLCERGIAAALLARSNELRFAPPPSARQPMLSAILRPNSGIGWGWLLFTCAYAPQLIHALPGPARQSLVRNTLGPLAGPSMKERLAGKAPLLLGRRIQQVEVVRGRVQMHVLRPDGTMEVVRADHVVAATGYRTNLERLRFIAPGLRNRIRVAGGAPVLSLDYETSVPGLYVIGPASAQSFGPVARFVYGAFHPARRLAHRFARESARQADRVGAQSAWAAARG